MSTDHSSPPLLTPEFAARLQRALLAESDELHQVFLDSAPEVLRTALKNRHLGEEHLLALLKRRDLPEDLLKAIYQLPVCEESHRLQVALAHNPGTPAPLIQSLMPRLFLFELLNICLLTGPSPDQKFAAERIIIQRLPTLPLGQKLTLARRGTPSLVGELLKEGDPKIMEACLDSPRLREMSVVQFLNGGRATAETISAIARHERWKNRINVKLSLLKNPLTPQIWFTTLLPTLPTSEIANLMLSRRITQAQHQLVVDEAKKRGLKSAAVPRLGGQSRS